MRALAKSETGMQAGKSDTAASFTLWVIRYQWPAGHSLRR